MDFLNPDGSQYRFDGDENIDLDAAMELMNEMHELDELIEQVQSANAGGDLDRIDRDLLEDLLGDDAAKIWRSSTSC